MDKVCHVARVGERVCASYVVVKRAQGLMEQNKPQM